MRGTEEERIYRKVKQYIERYHMIEPGDVVVTGVSGGADSICLLDMLYRLSKELTFRVLVVHVNHGVRKQADRDAAYVEELCRKRGILYYLKKVNMSAYAKDNGLSPEEAGRELRYLAFEEVLKEVVIDVENRDVYAGTCMENNMDYGKIAVAHNENDQAETMLFHLFRGSGIRGLSGMRPVRGQVIRPLLCLRRAQIETYLKERGLSYCTDSTNEEDIYTRNKIRHHILPYAEDEINANAVANMAHTASILEETEQYIERQVCLVIERCVNKQDARIVLQVSALQKEDPYIIKALLLHCLEEVTERGRNITRKHLKALMELLDKGGSKELSLAEGIKAYKEYDRLCLYREAGSFEKSGEKSVSVMSQNEERKEEFKEISVEIPGFIEVPELGIFDFSLISVDTFFNVIGKGYKNKQIIPEKRYTKWFDYDKITTALLLRTRHAGDYLTIDAALGKKTIKEYMIQEKIPKMQRERMYLLADGGHILWVPGYRISQYYKVKEDTRRILQVQLRGGESWLNE